MVEPYSIIAIELALNSPVPEYRASGAATLLLWERNQPPAGDPVGDATAR